MLKGIIGIVAGSALLFAHAVGAKQSLTQQEQQLFLADKSEQANQDAKNGNGKSAYHGKHNGKHQGKHRGTHHHKHNGKYHSKHHGKHKGKHHGKHQGNPSKHHHKKHHGKQHHKQHKQYPRKTPCDTGRCPVEMMQGASEYDHARMENYMSETAPEHR